MSVGRAVVLRLLGLVISIAIFVATGEVALRVIYRDAGERTLGGPGGMPFHHLSADGHTQRGRFDSGAKTAGKPRIMVLGDSITWGQGLRDWQDTWPELVARKLEDAGTPHEMAVLSLPGRNIPEHVAGIETWGRTLQPDVLIYQWYINDIEVEARRPENVRWWQQQPWHEPLQRSSYLYFFLESRLAAYWPSSSRSYVEYILEDYAPGSLEWAEFERYFHRFAAQARELAPTRLLVIYPQVPFSGTSPLQSVQDRLVTLASSAAELEIPPTAWIRHAGTPEPAKSRWNQVVKVGAGTVGPVIETRDYYVPASGADVTITLTGSNSDEPVATLDLIDAAKSEVTTLRLGKLPPAPDWQAVTLAVPARSRGRLVRLRISSTGRAAFSVANVAISANYGFKVVDLTDDLNAFDTHVSIFDAHPNETAHEVMAERIVQALQGAAARH